ncbi:hypothetical protein SAMN05216199_3952 [Pedococcus cremeus]|uniref:Uncharacterized protein n=1 Tax=Pedococcus cremeus TaxID=587636 RepID=A0A1H9XJY6_9MICO|nr:hypothetical protein [Pedococcus cremeus]SES46391.1 hypothetical protein SAMN05216199_3952 [Pedococcus cremeus]
MDPVFATEVAVVGVAAVGVLALVVRSVLRRRRHGREDEDWSEDVEPGKVKMRPGAGWGNGGSWH